MPASGSWSAITDEELAPRDVVSRAIVEEMRRTGAPHVFLDMTHRGADFIRERFPRIYETCLRYGVDLEREPAPVHPAAHYAMGGVRTDLNGRTTRAAAVRGGGSGVHGRARRQPPGQQFAAGRRGVRSARGRGHAGMGRRSGDRPARAPRRSFPALGEEEVRRLAWEDCGIARSESGLQRGRREAERGGLAGGESPERFELRNIHRWSLIARCALAREESRGAHYRMDFPTSGRNSKNIPSIGRSQLRSRSVGSPVR